MVIDSNSTRRSKDDRSGNNSKKKPGIPKGESDAGSASAKKEFSNLRRSARGTTANELITPISSATKALQEKTSQLINSSNMKRSQCLEKKDTTRIKRKLEDLEREKQSSSPLRRSGRGTENPKLVSLDFNNNVKVTGSADVNMKNLRKEKCVKQLILGASGAGEEATRIERPNVLARKTMNGRLYKAFFTAQLSRAVVPVLDEDLESAGKLSKADMASFRVSASGDGEGRVKKCSKKNEGESFERDCGERKEQSVSKSSNDIACSRVSVLGDGKDGVKGCSKKNEEVCVEGVCEGGKEQLVSMSNDDHTLTLSNCRDLETSCLNLKYSSREALSQSLKENGGNAFDESTICKEVIQDPEKLQVDNASVIELHTPEVEKLPDNNVAEGTGVASLSSSEREKDKLVGSCTSCFKRRRLNNNMSAHEQCDCITARINASRYEDGGLHAKYDGFRNEALKDSNVSMHDICTLDGGLPPDSSKFVEYWVPVSASNVQLEHYCAILLSNSITLRAASLSKDTIGTLHDTLFSIKKCCNHPYFVDSKLQGFLLKDVPEVDRLGVDIKASGKLQLLDTILSEIRSRGKKVLILYQFIRYEDMSLGDILDDYLRLRFGSNSYERVEGCILPKKRQAALEKFNDKDAGRFAFLLEKRACTSAIKLSSLDAIVMFDSDWNLKSDYRALHKLSIDGSLQPVKVFRLYTFCTLEEKVLELATESVTLDSNFQSFTRMACHRLLTWGAPYLFNKLDEFHSGDKSNSKISLCSDITLQKEVAGELLDMIIQNAESSCKSSLITKVLFTGGTYSKSTPLFGQSKVQSTDGHTFDLFWNELLECKNLRWRFLPDRSQCSRKRLQNFGELPDKGEAKVDDITKKQQKIVKSSADAASPRTSLREGGSLVVLPKPTASIPFSSKNISPASEVPMAALEGGTEFCDLQRNLHGRLKPIILELGELLQLPENVKSMGEIFLEYIVNNHQISSETKSILQALQISLIWVAASLLGHTLDKNQSLDVAKQQLGFCCTEEDVTNVYTKLRLLRKAFKSSSQNFKELEPKNDFAEDPLKKVQRKCKKRKRRLLLKHKEKIQELNRTWEEKRTEIQKKHAADSAVIRAMFSHAPAVRSDKLKRVDDEFAKKLDEHEREKELRLKEQKQKQLVEISKEDQKASRWLKLAQENVVSVSGQKQCLNVTETTELLPSSIPVIGASETVGYTVATEIRAVPSESIYRTATMEKQPGNLCCLDDAFRNSVVSGNHTSAEELAPPDGIISSTLEKDENNANEFAGDAKSTDTSKPDGESKEDNNLRDDLKNLGSGRVQNCINTAGSSKNNGSCTVPSLVSSSSLQNLAGAAEGVALQNSVPDEECSRPSTSAGVLDIDATECERTNTLEHATDDNRPPIIPNCSGVQEAVEKAPNTFAVGTKSANALKLDGESKENNSVRNVTNISDWDSTENCTDAGGNSGQDGICTDQPMVRSPSVEILEVPAQDIFPLQNLGLSDELRPSTCSNILDGDATGCEHTNTWGLAESNNHTSTEEQIPDCMTSGVQGIVENTPSEFTRGAKFPESSKPDQESMGDNNRRNNVNISVSDLTENCSYVAGSCRNDSIRTVPPLVVSPSLQIQVLAQDVELLQNVVPQNECSRPSISAGVLDRVTTECKNTNTLEQEAAKKIPDSIPSNPKETVEKAQDNALEQAAAEKFPDCITSNAQETVENAPDNAFEQAAVDKIPVCIISCALEAVESAHSEFENTSALERAAAEKSPDCIASRVQDPFENAQNELESTNSLIQVAAENIPDRITSCVQTTVENAPDNALDQAAAEEIPDRIIPSALEAVESAHSEFENTNALERAAAEKSPDCIASSVQDPFENAQNEFESTNSLIQVAAENIPDRITSCVQTTVENAPDNVLDQPAAEEIPDCIVPSAKEAVDNAPYEFENTITLEQAVGKEASDFIISSAQEAVENDLNELEFTNSFEQVAAEKIPDCITSSAQETVENAPDDALEQAGEEKFPDCFISSAREPVENASNEFENTTSLQRAAAEKVPDFTTSSPQEAVADARNELENANSLEQVAAEKVPDCITSGAQETVQNALNESQNSHPLEQAEVEHVSLPDAELNEHHLPRMEQPPSQNGEQSSMQFVENLFPPLQTQAVNAIMNDGNQMTIIPPTDIRAVRTGRHHHPSRPSQHIGLRQHPQTLQPGPSDLDPLQFELNRLHRETEEATKLHEAAKLQLKSELEKEIQELHRKYEAKLRGFEAEYLQKKTKLDSNRHKVYMNRILAETFRIKCLELVPSTSSGLYKGNSSNFLEQQLLQPSQPQRTPALYNPPNIVPTAASPRIAVPSVQSLPRPSPTVPSMQMRTPCTLPSTRPNRYFLTGGEIRAMPLRPLSFTPVPSSAQRLPGQDPCRRPPFPAATQLRPRVPVPVPPQHNRVSQPANMGIHSPVSGSNFVGLYLSQGGAQGGERSTERVNLTQSSVANDVVCLSDDEL